MKFTQVLGIEPVIKLMQKNRWKSDVLRYFYGRFANTIKIRDFAVPAILLSWTVSSLLLETEHCKVASWIQHPRKPQEKNFEFSKSIH